MCIKENTLSHKNLEKVLFIIICMQVPWLEIANRNAQVRRENFDERKRKLT